MLKHTTKIPQKCYTQLTAHILKTTNWELLKETSWLCLFRNRRTGKIYQVREKEERMADGVGLGDIGEEGGEGMGGKQGQEGVGDGGIFMEVLGVGGDFWLSEKCRGTLAQRLHKMRLTGSGGYSEEEITNTFMPILGALSLDKIPSNYPLTSTNIILDSAHQIRLQNPSLANPFPSPSTTTLTPKPTTSTSTSTSTSITQFSQLPLPKKLAITILQTALLICYETAKNLITNQDKVIALLVQRRYSWRIVGVVVILLGDGGVGGLMDWVDGRGCGDWYRSLKEYIDSFTETQLRHSTRTPTKQPDQTEDSQNQTIPTPITNSSPHSTIQSTITKYRSGRRIKLPQSQIHQSEEQYEIKPRRSRRH